MGLHVLGQEARVGVMERMFHAQAGPFKTFSMLMSSII